MNRQILEEASQWFVDFRVGDIDAGSRERFDEWLRRSPEHIRAYMEVAETYVDLPRPRVQRSPQELIAYARQESNVVPWDHVATDAGRTSYDRTPHAAHRLRRLALYALAASLGVVALAGLLVLGRNVWGDQIYVTDIGERRSVTLNDGSTIDLNARSRVRVYFSKAQRGVELLEGEALFEVAKDKTRPFVVESGGTSVRAVGTQFQVDRRVSRVTVTVVEGRVTVATGGGSVAPLLPDGERRAAAPVAAVPTTVSAGEQVIVADGAIAAPRRVNVIAATAWMQRPLTFDGSRLGDVVDEFNRNNSRQLVIEGAALEDLRISGVYSSTDPASLLRFLKEQPGIQVVESGQVVRITRP